MDLLGLPKRAIPSNAIFSYLKKSKIIHKIVQIFIVQKTYFNNNCNKLLDVENI
jgi:hypothetical protein